MCTVYFVDEATKRKIAAYNAKFREVSASPFGADDQIGMLNLIDAESRAAIVSRADAGKVFDLAVDHFVGMPGWLAANDPAFQIWMTHTPRGEELADVMAVGADANRLVSYSGDAVAMYTHTGTHVDSLNHFGYRGRIFNNFSAQDHLGSRHWQISGADKHPPVIARGLLLDVAGLHGLEMLPPSYGIGPDDLAGCLKHQETELRPGDVVMVRTGRMRAWPDPGAYMTESARPQSRRRRVPGQGRRDHDRRGHPLSRAGAVGRPRELAGRAYLSARGGGHPDDGDRRPRGARGRAGLRVRVLRRLHQAARRHRRADAAGRDAAQELSVDAGAAGAHSAALGSIMWQPLTPSTVCVTRRSPASEHSM